MTVNDCPRCRGTGCLPDGSLCPAYEAEVDALNAESNIIPTTVPLDTRRYPRESPVA